MASAWVNILEVDAVMDTTVAPAIPVAGYAWEMETRTQAEPEVWSPPSTLAITKEPTLDISTLDDVRIQDGRHRLRVRTLDAAGNRAPGGPAYVFDLDHVAPPGAGQIRAAHSWTWLEEA